MTSEEYRGIQWPDPYGHPLAGPIYIVGAKPGDKLAVTLLTLEIGDWGWTDSSPESAYLGKEVGESFVKTYTFTQDRKATRYMIAWLMDVRGMERHEANMLSSVAANLKIAEVVDGNVLVTMHISKSVFGKI